jgi:hypothetical protein
MELRHLVIELNESSVQFTSLVADTVETTNSFVFVDKKDYRYKEQLDEFILESGLKNREHDEHTISWSSPRTALIPSNVFAESKSEKVYRLCFGESTGSSDIDYNRLPELSIVNVYEIPLWVKSYFVVRHPRSIIQHEGTMILRTLFASPTFRLKIVLVPYANYFLLAIAKENKLMFYAAFDFQTADDIIYHLMFSLQQNSLLKEDGELIWVNGNGSSEAIYDQVKTNLERINDFKNLKVQFDHSYIANSHKLCV